MSNVSQLKTMFESHMNSEPVRMIETRRVYFNTQHLYFGEWASPVKPRVGAVYQTVDIPVGSASFISRLLQALGASVPRDQLTDSMVDKIEVAFEKALPGEPVQSRDWKDWQQGTEVWKSLNI